MLVFLSVVLVAIQIPDGVVAAEMITITAQTASEGQVTFVIVMHFICIRFLSSSK